MKARRQIRTLAVTAIVVLMMTLFGQFLAPIAVLAEGGGGDPPLNPNPPDSMLLAPDTTQTTTTMSSTDNSSLLDAVITVLEVII